jgi:hypothetical protein
MRSIEFILIIFLIIAPILALTFAAYITSIEKHERNEWLKKYPNHGEK